MLKVLVLDSGLKDARQGSTKIFEIFFAQETGLQISYTNLPRNKRGKPSSYKGWHFNLSHSGEYLAMVMSDEKEVGIDVEKRRTLRPAMARRILAPREEALEGDLLRSWVLKEAYVKMLGEGLQMDFRKISCGEILANNSVEDKSNADYICFVIS